MNGDYKDQIDHFIRNIPSDKAGELIWTFINTLKGAYDLRQSTAFSLPHDRIKNAGISYEDRKLLLQQLDEKGIVTLYITTNISSPRGNAPRVAHRRLAYDYPDIIDDSLVEIQLEHAFFYLYEQLSEKCKKPATIPFEWKPEPKHHKGTLLISGNKISFQGGRFGGIDILITRIDHDVTTEELRKAIAKHSKRKKESQDINISQWKNELMDDRKDFAQHFEVKFFRPNLHRLLFK